jgi:signal transduction histidine kinase/CheY-like chemotaxis protein
MEKILIVDDEKEIRDMLQSYLSRDYAVYSASSGNEALELIRNNKFDLAMIDILLGDMNGKELLKYIKETDIDTEVIILSGYGTFQDVVEIIKTGAYDFIEKPFELESISAKIHNALRARELSLKFQYLDKEFNNIRQLKEYSENILNNMCMGLLTVSNDNEIRTCNPYLADIFKAGCNELQGRSFRDFAERYFDQHEKILKSFAILKEKGESFDFLLLNNRTGTNQLHLRIMGSSFKSGYLIFVLNVTEEYEAKQRLLQNEKMALLGEFISSITHGLGNNIANIISNASALQDEAAALEQSGGRPVPAENVQRVLGYSKKILKRTWEMDENIRSLLRFSRQPRLKKEMSDINAIVEEGISVIKSYGNPGISFEKTLAKDLPLISVNPYQIKDVIVDLALNGIQAVNNNRGIIAYTTRMDSSGTMIQVLISDTGPGILEEHREKIFDPFFTTKTNGTGLGLTNSKNIIKQHNGTMSFNTEPGKGTTFIIGLPVSV